MVCARGPLSASEPCNAGSWRFAQDAHALGYRIKYNVVHIFKLFYTPTQLPHSGGRGVM